MRGGFHRRGSNTSLPGDYGRPDRSARRQEAEAIGGGLLDAVEAAAIEMPGDAGGGVAGEREEKGLRLVALQVFLSP